MPDIPSTLLQFGAAGLVAWMWLIERRAATIREKQLADAHDRILGERTSLSVVLRALESSTRVLTSIELGQRQLLDLLSTVTRTPKPPRSRPSRRKR